MASIDSVGILRVSQSGGTVVIWDVMHRQMLLNWLSSSAKEEQTNGRRGAGRDQETVISQEEVQGGFPIDPVEISSHFTS